jgi:hypothetical protein
MQKTSINKVTLRRDRNGVIEEHIRIKIWQKEKNPETKLYTIIAEDYIVRNLGTEEESLELNKDNYGNDQIKLYYISYDDYEAEKEYLLDLYPSDLTGSELDDFLLLKKLN